MELWAEIGLEDNAPSDWAGLQFWQRAIELAAGEHCARLTGEAMFDPAQIANSVAEVVSARLYPRRNGPASR